MEEHCFQAFLPGSLSYLSYLAQAHLSRDGFGPSGLGPFTSISNPEMSHRYATGQSDKHNFFKLRCVTLTSMIGPHSPVDGYWVLSHNFGRDIAHCLQH